MSSNSDEFFDDTIRWPYCPIESIHPIIQFKLNAETWIQLLYPPFLNYLTGLLSPEKNQKVHQKFFEKIITRNPIENVLCSCRKVIEGQIDYLTVKSLLK